MSENDGVIDRPTLLAGVLMQIAAADTHGLHLEQNVFFTNARNGEFTKLNRVWILCVINQTDHSQPFCVIGEAQSNWTAKISFFLVPMRQISKLEIVNLLLL
jgi:hypothetical protein